MALDYERGDLLFEDDFTGDLSAWTQHELGGIQDWGSSYATVSVDNNQLVLYCQHDGTGATDASSRPCDSIAAAETTASWDRSSFVEIEFSYTYNPTWQSVTDGDSKVPYVPGVEWGDLGSDPYKKVAEYSRNLPMQNGWANRYGEREWGGDTGDATYDPQLSNDRYDNYEIRDENLPVSQLSESSTHRIEAVAVDEEAQMRLVRADGTVNEVKNNLAEVISASGHAFVEGDNIGLNTDQSVVFDEGDEVGLGEGGRFTFFEGTEVLTTESVSVSDQQNHLVIENRIVNNFDNPYPDNEGWIEIRVDYVKVWEAVPK